MGVVILGYYSMLTLQACCNCPDPDLPYFDYKSIDIEVNSPNPVSLYPDAGFRFFLKLDSIEYLATQVKGHSSGWGLINSAYACSCDNNGDLGAKYGFQAINIYADSIFDASIPDGEPLNSLFEVPTHYNNETKKTETIPLENISNFPYRLSESTEIIISSKSIPVALNRPYYFEIEVIKENGDTIRTAVGPLIWKE